MATGKAKRRKRNQQAAFRTAFSDLAGALHKSGLEPLAAERFARLVLSRPGLVIGPKGGVRYKGRRFNAAAFANSTLADFVTGRKAERLNKAAIEGDPGYLSELADLTFNRDQSISALDDQRRRQILDFGDPGFAQDPLLAGEAAANPFSTSKLMQAAYERELAGVRQASARYGTLFGGGYQSGVSESGRQNAARQTEATRSLEDLLAQLNEQASGARRGFETGRARGLQTATQRLLESGQIHAALPPNLKNLGYRFWGGPRRYRF